MAMRDVAAGNTEIISDASAKEAIPKIKGLVDQNFVLWSADIQSSDISSCLSGLPSPFDLPLICVINPNEINSYKDRTAGYGGVYPAEFIKKFYDRLSTHKPSIGAAASAAPQPPQSATSLAVVMDPSTRLDPVFVRITGKIYYQGMPACALVLANGQHMFTSPANGAYDLKVPLDPNGEITLFGFAEGLMPYKKVFKP